MMRMIKIILTAVGIGLLVVLGVCIAAFVIKTRLGGRGGYKDKRPRADRS
jgi:hypothetical protein